ncbi:MAG: hypothetical protein LEGION0403_FIIPPAGN_02796 [Legionella sp.]
MLGNSSAKAAIPTPKPPKPKHGSFLGKIIVAIVATVATVLTAGAFALGMGVTGSLFSAGLTALGGAITGTAGAAGIGTVLGVGLAAGFVGSIAGQTAANLMGLQSGIDFGGALISGLTTAATAGIGYGLKNIGALQNVSSKIGTKYNYKYFSASSAFEMMEQNAASQAFNTTIRRHQHFDWTELGVATLTGGLMGSKPGKEFGEKLEILDNHSGMLRAELQTLAGAGAQSLTTGTHFDALQVLGDNLGSAIGNAVVGRFAWSGLEDRVKDIAKENIKELVIDDLLTDWENYKKLNNWDDTIEGFKRDLAPPIVTPFYEYSAIPDEEQYSAIPEAERACAIPTQTDSEDNIVYQESPYSFEEALNKQMSLKKGENPTYDRKGTFVAASREQVRQFMDVEIQFSDPKKRIQFMDLQYQEGVRVEHLDALLADAGVLKDKGAVFLQAAKTHNVNPIYLVAHALHESDEGKSRLAKTQNNFFGIGAYDRNPYEGGKKFALEHGWNTVEKGIMGGAEFISKKWVNKSQNTLYAMRWNPTNPGSHQYATDINWANAQLTNIYPYIKELSQIDSSCQPKYILPKYR